MIENDPLRSCGFASGGGHSALLGLALRYLLPILRPLLAWAWRQRDSRRRRVISGEDGPFVWRLEQTAHGRAHVYLGRGSEAQNAPSGRPGPRLER